MAKDTRIAFRASEDLKNRLQKAAKKIKLSETALAEAAVEATVDYIEKHGGIWLPLQVVPRPREAADFKAAGATPSAPVGGSFTSSTRISPGAPSDIDASLRLDRDTARKTKSSPRPRAHVKEVAGREKGKRP